MKRRYWIWVISVICLLSLCACEQKPAVHTVTIDYDYLGEREEQTVAAGEKIAEPTDAPTKMGYENLGWFLEENGTLRQWDFSRDTVNGDITLVLRREPMTSSLELVLNDGSGKIEKMTMTYGEAFELPIPEREGYTFMGWYFANTRQPERGVWQGTEATFHMAKWTVFAPGTMVSLGTYEQDGDKTNGQEPIEWLVVDRNEDGSAYLLVSRYLLDWQPMHDQNSTVAWQNRSLRRWLNDSFYQSVFTDAERERIRLTPLADVGTQDHIFLPTLDELALLGDPQYLAGTLTPYANQQTNGYISHRGTLYGYATVAYWLRYDVMYSTSHVDTTGLSAQKSESSTKAGIRPAMWVDAAYIDILLK